LHGHVLLSRWSPNAERGPVLMTMNACGAQKFNRSWRELGGFCLAGLWHGAAERAGPSRGAERKWGLRIGREVELGE
jgi:hypothetical protein